MRESFFVEEAMSRDLLPSPNRHFLKGFRILSNIRGVIPFNKRLPDILITGEDDSLILPRHLRLRDIYLQDILLWVLLLWEHTSIKLKKS